MDHNILRCIVLLLVFNLRYCSTDNTCTILKHVNGCSTPLRLPFPYKALFTPACNTHDACYRCGQRYDWDRTECDVSFKKLMYGLCANVTTDPSRKKRDTGWGSIRELFNKIYQGWKKATKNKTTKEEAARLWKEAMSIFKMIIKWTQMSGAKAKCIHGADIYYRAVDVFGIYAYRVKSKPYCDETCAGKLGNLKNIM